MKGKTTLVVWLVFLALGGGILALYYSRIHYLPDIEWSSSIVYLAAASFIGGGVGVLFALSVFLPGVIWSEALLYDPNLSKAFYIGSDGEPCLRTVLLRLGVPFGLVLLISHVTLATDLIVGAMKLGVIVYSVIAVVLLVWTLFVMRRIFARLLLVLLISLVTLATDLIVGATKLGVIVYSVIAVVLLVRTFFVMRLIFARLLANESVCDLLEEALPKGIFKYAAFIVGCIIKLPPSKACEPLLDDTTAAARKRHIFKYASWFTLSVFLSQISILIV